MNFTIESVDLDLEETDIPWVKVSRATLFKWRFDLKCMFFSQVFPDLFFF